MAKQKLNKAAKIITYIILSLVLIAVVGGIVYLTRGGKENIKTFSMEIGNRIILRDEKNLRFESGEKIIVKSPDIYAVSVYAYWDLYDFEFTVGNEHKKWSDYSGVDFLKSNDSGLKISRDNDGFILDFDNVQSIINTKYEVVLPENLSTDIFRLAVTSNNSTINIYFSAIVQVENVRLPENVTV